MRPELEIRRLGLLPYREALELQEKCVEACRQGAAGDVLMLLEHPPVITLGRNGKTANLRWSEEQIRAAGFDLQRVSRGGDVTLHAPGQLVGYLICDLTKRDLCDAHRYLRELEATLILALEKLGVAAETREGMTGVFRADATAIPHKLVSIGVGLRGWVSYHGFALNVSLPAEAFTPIVPCGLSQVRMSCVAELLEHLEPKDLAERTRSAVEIAFRERWA